MAALAVLGLACQVLVATVLAAATVGKALDGAGTARVLLGIGVPDRPARLVSQLLAAVEGLVVVALVAAPQAGAIGAAGLFAGFTVTLAAARGFVVTSGAVRGTAVASGAVRGTAVTPGAVPGTAGMLGAVRGTAAGRDAGCGCFGALPVPDAGRWPMGRNLVLLGAALLAAGTPVEQGVTRPATALAVALTTAVALVVVGGQAAGVARPR